MAHTALHCPYPTIGAGQDSVTPSSVSGGERGGRAESCSPHPQGFFTTAAAALHLVTYVGRQGGANEALEMVPRELSQGAAAA